MNQKQKDTGYNGDQESDFVIFAVNWKLRIRYLLQLAKAIPMKNKFLIVGNGPWKTLKTIAGNDKRIIFLDFQNQQKMPSVYRMGNIFILPSKSETWGLAINEAMA
jgi:glycosyltransferase involved in cell wall biosynthesis